jgi:hypothetical protein
LKFHLKFSETCNWILAAKILMCLKDEGSSKWKLRSNMVHMAIKHPPTHTAVEMNCYYPIVQKNVSLQLLFFTSHSGNP